jgi:zinc protease
MAVLRPLRVAILAVIPALALAAGARAAPPVAPEASTFTLTNGLQVVVIPDHRTPAVSHMVWYRAGSAEDPPGKSGIAHFLEHLMFKGTRAHPAGEFETRITEIGGNQNASTSTDYTEFHQNVSKEHLGLVMEYEADRMVNVDISEEAVKTEREVILEERRMRTDNDPGAQLGEAMGAALFQNSHYGIPIIGWAHEMETLDRADALAFYDRYYTPNNAIVIVAGDVTEDEVRKLAEATYGKVARRAEPPPRFRAKEPPPRTARTVTLADARVTQPALRRSYLVPSYTNAPTGEAPALDILGEILGGGSTSRLYKALMLGKAVATNAGAGYNSTSLDDTTFTVYGVPRGDISLEALAADIDAVIAELLDKGVTDDEVARAKKRMLAGAIYAQDSQGTLARVFGDALTSGQTVAAVQNWPSDIEKVTAADVNAVARKYLDLRRSVTGYLVGKPADGRS